MTENQKPRPIPPRPAPNDSGYIDIPPKRWQKILGNTLGICLVVWFSALLLMFMVWSLIKVYFLLFT